MWGGAGFSILRMERTRTDISGAGLSSSYWWPAGSSVVAASFFCLDPAATAGRVEKPMAAEPWNRVGAAAPPPPVASATASEDDGRWHHRLVQRAQLAREAGGSTRWERTRRREAFVVVEVFIGVI